jgi:amino acid transporter
MSDDDDEPPLDSTETEAERVERNWNEILQELRVIQTGTQILTGFLLALAFQPRFAELGQVEVTTYLVLVALAGIATVLALAPVSLHRALFRKRAKPEIVRLAHRLLMVTLVAVALTLAGTTVLIFDVVVGPTAGLIAGAVALIVIAAAWLLMPAIVRRNRRQA